MIILILLLLGTFAPAAAQAWPRCSSGCEASDLTVTDLRLDVHGCVGESGTATADVYVTFYKNTNAGRYCRVFVTDLWVNGVLYQDDLSKYFLPSLTGQGYFEEKVGTIEWPCGGELQLKDVLVEWDTNNKPCVEDCDNYPPSKCSFMPIGPSVRPPAIESVTQSSNYPCPGQDVVVTAHVTDADGTVTSVTLNYGSGSVAMTDVGGGNWQATIPGQAAGTTLTITVTAEDNDGNKVTTPPHDKTWSGPDCTITAPASVCAYSTGNTASVADAGEGASYEWTITGGTIAAGQDTPSITWTAGAPGTATIGVTVTSTYGCECTASTDVTLEDCSTDLSITKSDNPDPVAVGGLLTYTLTVTNNGPGYATGVVVKDTLPSCLTNAEYSTDGGSSWSSYVSGSDISLNDIPNGGSSTVLIRGEASCEDACKIVNTATVLE